MPYNLLQRKSPRAKWHDYNGGNYFVTFCTENRELYFGNIVGGKMQFSAIGEYAHLCVEKIPEINDNVAIPEFVVMPNHVHMIVIVDTPIEWPDDDRLPQWNSPTTPNENMMHESGSVGLSYHGSRIGNDNDFRLPQWDSPTTAPNGCHFRAGYVGLSYHGSRNGKDVSYHGSRNQDSRCDELTIIDFEQIINEEMQRRSNCCGRLSRIIGQYKSAITKYANQNDISFAWQPRFHDHIIRNIKEMNLISNYIQNNPIRWELDRFYKRR